MMGQAWQNLLRKTCLANDDEDDDHTHDSQNTECWGY